MHVFLYEWITGGGLVEEPSPLPPSLLAEGSAMATAMAVDLSAIENSKVTVLRDMRLDELAFPGCEVIEVHSSTDCFDEIERLATAADYTLLIAPELDNILFNTVRHALQTEANLLTPSAKFVALTTNKHKTAKLLAEADIPVPKATLLAADEEKLPADFDYPAVLKPVSGAGSQHTLLLASSQDEPPTYPWPRRLEQFCPGIAASVAAICGPVGRILLTPCRQTQSTDGRFAYRGGSLIHEPALIERAKLLADRTLDVLPPARGYVGIDLVLGNAGDGSEDLVIEVNPRLTTSYVGLRAATKVNLAQVMLDSAAGRSTDVPFHLDRLEFLADGTILQATNNT